MSTDDRKPLRRRIMSDDERARMRRTGDRSPVYIEPELTPPPQSVPLPENLGTYDKIELLSTGIEQLTIAVGKLWDERGNSSRLVSLEAAVAGYTRQVELHQQNFDQFVMPAVKTLTGNVEALLQSRASMDAQLRRFFEHEWPRHESLMERFEKALDTVADRLTRLEAAVDRLHSSDQALAARLSANEANVNALDVRITALEHRGTAVIAASAERTRIFTGARVAIAGVAGALGWIAERLLG